MIKIHMLRYVLLVAACIAPTHSLGQASIDKKDLVRVMGLRQGGWHTTLLITAADMVPLKKGSDGFSTSQSKLRERIGTQFENDDCIGSGLGANGNLILPGISIEGTCTFDRIEAHDGRLDLKATCGKGDTGFQADMTVQATYSAAAMNAKLNIKTFSKEAGHIVNMTIETTSRHDAQCRLSPK